MVNSSSLLQFFLTTRSPSKAPPLLVVAQHAAPHLGNQSSCRGELVSPCPSVNSALHTSHRSPSPHFPQPKRQSSPPLLSICILFMVLMFEVKGSWHSQNTNHLE